MVIVLVRCIFANEKTIDKIEQIYFILEERTLHFMRSISDICLYFTCTPLLRFLLKL